MVIFIEGHQSKCIERDSGNYRLLLLHHAYGLSYNCIVSTNINAWRKNARF